MLMSVPGANLDGRADATLVVDALGTAVAIEMPRADLGRLSAQWSWCLTESEPTAVVSLMEHDDDRVRDYSASSAVTRQGVEALRGRRLNLHAAGLADATGRVLTLVAASGTGKTTASAMLARSLGYVTDECVSVGPQFGDVISYPKPLSFVIDASEPGHKRQQGPEEIGLERAEGPLRLGPVVLLERDGSSPPRLEPLEPLVAALALLPQTSAISALPDPLVTLLDRVQGAGGVHRLHYAEISAAVPMLRDLLGEAEPLPTGYLHWPAPPASVPDATSSPVEVTVDMLDATSRLVRAPWTDAVEMSGEVLVLSGIRPALLSGLGAMLWLRAVEPLDLATATAAAVFVHGPHPDAAVLINQAATQLVEVGLLVCV